MNNTDHSKEKCLSHEVACYNCKRLSPKETKTFYAQKAGERYRGNLKIKTETPRRNPHDGKVYYETKCYTGRYVMKFGNFCSVKCGLIWANNQIETKRESRKRNLGEGRSICDNTKNQLKEFRDGLIRTSFEMERKQ